MKNFTATVFVALANGGLLVSAATAATLTYNPGDLFLGFRSSSSTTDFLINIGPASNYRGLAPGTSFSLSIGPILGDLDAVFGATWKTANRPDLFWGVAGAPYNVAAGGDLSNTLYATSPENPFGTLTTTPAAAASNSAQAAPAGKMQNLADSYVGAGDSANGVSAALNGRGLRQDGTVAGSWASFMNRTQTFTGNSFLYFADGIEGNFGSGEENTAIDLFRIEKTTQGGTGANAYQGTFKIDSAGIVTYSVIPEPVTGVMLGFGAGILGFSRRRQRVVA